MILFNVIFISLKKLRKVVEVKYERFSHKFKFEDLFSNFVNG